MKNYRMQKRTILQLDFDNSPKIPGIGKDFDPEDFGRTIKNAGIGVVMLGAKCHHGYCYYPTKSGAMHPNLNFDLFGKEVEALRKHGVETFAYFTVVRENRLGRMHPDWMWKVPGEPVDMERDQWLNVCISSPMVEEVLFPQVVEVAEKYPVIGIYFDIVVYPAKGCLCRWCQKEMKEREIDPNDEVKRIEFGLEKKGAFLKRAYEVVKGVNPNLAVSFNNCLRFGMREFLPYVDFFDVECVPHVEGYWFYPTFSRYLQTLGKDFRGVACRFHKTWGDLGSLKTVDQIRFEGATMLAGDGVVGSGGDRPQGGCRLQKQVYKNTGKVFRQVNEITPYIQGAEPMAEIAILADSQNSPSMNYPSANIYGAVKMLLELHHQFTVIDEFENLSPYRLVILPNNQKIGSGLRKKISDYIENGGSVIAVADAVIPQNGTDGLMPYFGLSEYLGLDADSIGYMRAKEPGDFLDRQLEICIYDKFRLTRPTPEAKIWFSHVRPLFEIYPGSNLVHRHAPPGEETGSPAVCFCKKCAYIAAPIFSSYFIDGNVVFKNIVGRIIQELLPDPILETSVPANAEVRLYQKGKGFMIHLVHFYAARRGVHYDVIDRIPEVVGCNLKIRVKHAPSSIKNLIRKRDVPFQFSNGVVTIAQETLGGWEVFLIE